MEPAETSAPALAFVRDRGRRARACPLVIALHDRGGDGPGGLAEARALFGDAPEVLAPQAARPCNPFQSNLRGPRGYEGFSWYLGDDPLRPEAASFGDALAQLDALVRTQPGRCVLSGRGQGGVLALALALYAPEGVVGVHASQAGLAAIDGWSLPQQGLSHLDVLLLDFPAMQASRTRSLLERRRAKSVTCPPAGSAPGRSWFERLCGLEGTAP